MEFQFEDFLAQVDLELLAECVGKSWSWLEPLRKLKPVALTLFGDVFLIDRDNAIYFLDTNFGDVERVATSNDAFRARLQEEAFARAILRIGLASELRELHVVLRPGQCFGFGLSPLLGGQVAAHNVAPLEMRVVLDWLGQLAAGTRTMPVGQQFRITFPGWPGAPRPPSNGSVTKHARDRSSFADPPPRPPGPT